MVIEDFLLEASLLKRALDSSSCAITIADAKKQSMPLIYTSAVFEKITGYSDENALGRNCRFLQGNDRKQKGVKTIRDALIARKACTVELRNYKKDGSLFWNEVHLSPVFDSRGTLTHYIGVQTDITKRVEAEHELKDMQKHLKKLVKERTNELQEKNIALKELISQIQQEKQKLTDQVIENVDNLVLPMLKKLKARSDQKEKTYIDLIEKNLLEITREFGAKISRKLYSLTPREIEICNLIRSGLGTKEIAEELHVTPSTLENQRNSIRKKLGISNHKINLTSYLQSF